MKRIASVYLIAYCVVALQARAAEPISVRIKAQTVGVVGDKIYLTLQETGDIKSRVWSVFPAGTVGFDTHDGDRFADFSTRFPGTYVFFVSVASGDQVAHHFHVLEMRADLPDIEPPKVGDAVGRDSPPPRTKMAEVKPRTKAAAAPAQKATPKEDATALITRWTKEVQTDDRRGEAQALAQVLRQTANSITTGLLAGGDALSQAHGLTRLDSKLKTTEKNWQPWWNHMETEIWPQMKRLYGGTIPDANAAAILANIAAILERI